MTGMPGYELSFAESETSIAEKYRGPFSGKLSGLRSGDLEFIFWPDKVAVTKGIPFAIAFCRYLAPARKQCGCFECS